MPGKVSLGSYILVTVLIYFYYRVWRLSNCPPPATHLILFTHVDQESSMAEVSAELECSAYILTWHISTTMNLSIASCLLLSHHFQKTGDFALLMHP